ncbi:asparagine synthase-related protein, partial [Xanthomonas perforans]
MVRGEQKYILKRLLELYLPQELIYRPKRGFGAPVGRWLRGPLR